MGWYYMSVCHTCEEAVMWAKCHKEIAEEWHKKFHPTHNTQFGGDYDDEFYSVYFSYKDLGIKEGADFDGGNSNNQQKRIRKPTGSSRISKLPRSMWGR